MINTRLKLINLAGQVTTQQLRTSTGFLVSKRPVLSGYEDVEDLAVILAENPDPELSGFEHHFRTARNAILRKLWSKGVLIGTSVVENLLFSAVRDSIVADPVAEVFKRIRDFGLHRPGFVLYPLHSFGIVGFGLLGFLTGNRLQFIDEKAGIAIAPQANNEEELLRFLKAATEKLKMKKMLPLETIEHYLRSGVMKWLLRNPLLLVKCKTFSQRYFENQRLLKIKLKLATTLVTMLHGMQKPRDDSRIYSTSSMNNFETLDIKHYIVFEVAPNGRPRFNAHRVPMNLSRAELSEISELNVELNPVEWNRRPKVFGRIAKALEIVERGYMEHCVGSKIETPASRVFRKTYLALDYFRRSFRSSGRSEDGIINLAVAFETLLTDYYAGDVAMRIRRRVRLLLKSVRGSRKMTDAVLVLSDLRNKSVHTGQAATEPDWQQCRLAFIHAFIGLTGHFPRLSKLPVATNAPIGELIGDS